MSFNFIVMGTNIWPLLILFLFVYIGYKVINHKSNYTDILSVDDQANIYMIVATDVINDSLERIKVRNAIGNILADRWQEQQFIGYKIINSFFTYLTFSIYLLIIISYYTSLMGLALVINIPTSGVIMIIIGGIFWVCASQLKYTKYVNGITNYNYKWFWKIKKHQIDITSIVMINDMHKHNINEINNYISNIPQNDWDLSVLNHSAYDVYDTVISFRHKKDSVAFKLSLL